MKLITGDLYLCKVLKKDIENKNAYLIKVYEKNGKNHHFELTIKTCEIERICIFPIEDQQGIELTVEYVPSIKLNYEKHPNVVSFGKINIEE
ncbi:hypothetical protein [Fredinandcohnia quinoae]|uniref:DUF3127 domain-containing protein n=1 Tax=Fredinandcohnia quinoae TaxID=2918902 RepID=A0AAW5E8W9_9BACI|nr:hypothetical protein [Fredinandcohnia sp. SECRCQ15]MCH1626457.1 hypothetical protein [Fredinandcohnia sp. SECRCQ15]